MNVPGVGPLTRDEREALMRWASVPENATMWKVETDEVIRWEMTVRVAEARIEALRAALEVIAKPWSMRPDELARRAIRADDEMQASGDYSVTGTHGTGAGE